MVHDGDGVGEFLGLEAGEAVHGDDLDPAAPGLVALG